jgi:radical SAM protein with 4Fe4S-binding SPASM domain
MDKYIELKNAGMDFCHISQHSKELPDYLAITIKSIKERFPLDKCIAIEDIYNTEFKNNRGGLVNVASKKFIGCGWPFMLTFDYAGNVILCCNDYNSSVVFGNIEKDDLYSIWNSNNFINIRSKILSGFLPYEMCKKCSSR